MKNTLVPLYRELAAKGAYFYGLSVLQHEAYIRSFMEMLGATSMLDFGCGRGDAYLEPHLLHERLHIRAEELGLYDPAFEQHAELPGRKFDVVVCSDVLEHVPGDEVDAFIKALFAHADRGVWASVCCRLAKKSFEDGTNMHVTVQPFTWWRAKFAAAAGNLQQWQLVETP